MLITHIYAKLDKKSRFQQDVFKDLAFDPSFETFVLYTIMEEFLQLFLLSFGCESLEEIFSDTSLDWFVCFILFHYYWSHHWVAVVYFFLLSCLLWSHNFKLVNKHTKKDSVDNSIEYVNEDHRWNLSKASWINFNKYKCKSWVIPHCNVLIPELVELITIRSPLKSIWIDVAKIHGRNPYLFCFEEPPNYACYKMCVDD